GADGRPHVRAAGPRGGRSRPRPRGAGDSRGEHPDSGLGRAGDDYARGDRRRGAAMSGPAFLFDLDGTLMDSVYQHVLAWRDALEGAGIELSVWRIHRRIGMSGGLFRKALVRETGRRTQALGVGLLSGGYGQEELERAGAYRVYQDPADLLEHLDEVGVREPT